jgi:hypothetical protein
MDTSLPEKIPNLDQTQATEPVESGISKGSPGNSFQDVMNAPAQPTAETTQAQSNSPYDLAKGQATPMQPPTAESIQQQMNTTSNTLDQLHGQLNTKNLKLKQSQKYLLRNKLSEASSNIRTAAIKTGVDPGPAPKMTAKQSPIKRYLAYVSDSQNQIASVQAKMKEMSATGSLSPGDMLLIQVKLNKAQQALEYSSILLGKAVDDVKTLFNVQI